MEGTESIREMNIEEFLRRLNVDKSSDKKFVFFLGAGCSVSSGIPAAGELVRDNWIPRLRDYQAKDRADLEAWAKEAINSYDPENPARSFGELIDKLFVTPVERQRELENLCDGRTPSFGYAVLAQLIALPDSPFNIVLTTNFDDLVSDAL